nr:immunoglobulin heavy chain junction region [Homo sapiens]
REGQIHHLQRQFQE